MFKNLKIGVRLAIGFGLVVALMIALGVVGILRVAELNGKIDYLTNDLYPKSLRTNAIINSVNEDARSVRNIILLDNEQERNAQKARIDELLELVRLTGARHRLAGSLSHGQKQWLEIGMLLAQEPLLLLVDEPAAGMTDAETMRTAELLRDIAGERSVVVIEHDMDFVRALDCKVTVLHRGAVLAEGSLDHVSANQEVIEVYLGR